MQLCDIELRELPELVKQYSWTFLQLIQCLYFSSKTGLCNIGRIVFYLETQFYRK